ncbi:Transcription factor mbp1 (MBF subunit p120) [Recurvomyces mirabilis]|nr:Transcription factor mbp1 (MBF subunit p120) [Recurvomyces mirabilis]
MAGRSGNTVYSATYSNVPIYELLVEGHQIMRRQGDGWCNATHILKLAGLDKPARTRVLEREVQKGIHEKVQGGYGKYQGTWIPLDDGRTLAAKNGVLEQLRPIFDFVPGDRSPPPAPKHETAASSKPRAPRQAAQRKVPAASMYQQQHHHQNYDQMDVHEETPDNDTVASESQFDDYDMAPYTGGSRKRRRIEDHMSQADREHQLWAEELLDYFMLQEDPSMDAMVLAPTPPGNVDINRPIDEKGHSALHWAAAMGDIEVVKDLIRRGASIDSQSKSGETPLMRSVIFTNSFDKRNMEKLASLLIRTVNMQEWSGSTVFHQIAGITQSKKKYECARYYMDCILSKMTETLSPGDVERVLNEQDRNGDTAITIAARYGARKCVRSLIGRNAAVDVMNLVGETADQLIVQLNHRRQERNRQFSSSPFQAAEGSSRLHTIGGAVQAPSISGIANGIPFDPLIPHTSLTTVNAGNGTLAPSSATIPGREVYSSEVALTLTSSLLPTIITKTRSLASALDTEMADKDSEVREAERVIERRKAELEGLRRQSEEWTARDLELAAEVGEEEEELERVLAELTGECESLVESEEAATLADHVKAEDKKAAKSSSSPHLLSDSSEMDLDPHSSAYLERKLALARHLSSLQLQRKELIKTIVRNISLAGDVGAGSDSAREKQRQYRRLITGALNVREEDVEGLLPEIVGELEDAEVVGGLVA